jgi:PHD/YefM family antitoxin component YafN of YafNO toxin-antitoxin module
MGTGFTRDEMISSTAAVKNFGKVVAELAGHKREKTAVIRNNEIAVVMLPVDDYEYMARIVDFVEHLELYDLIAQRGKTAASRRIALDDLLREEGIAL